MHSGLQADPVHHKIMWSPFVRLDTWVGAALETPLSIWDPMPLLSAGTAAFLSRELSRACCFPFQMVVAWGSGALCFTKWFPLHAKLKLFGEISRSECSPASLCFLWDGRKVAPCLCSDEHFEKTCLSVQSTGPGRAWPDAAAVVDIFSVLFFLSGSQQSGVPYYTDPGGPVMNPMAMAFHVQPNSPQGNPVYPPPPSYCNTPPPPYEQVVKSSTWGLSGFLTWLCEKKVPLQNDRDGEHPLFWTLASSPSPLSLPSLHLSSLKLLAKG